MERVLFSWGVTALFGSLEVGDWKVQIPCCPLSALARRQVMHSKLGDSRCLGLLSSDCAEHHVMWQPWFRTLVHRTIRLLRLESV